MQKQNYAIAALDMDGTLLNSHHETTPYTREVIRRAAEAGKVVALSTGRCMSELKDHVRQLDAIRYIICENGACIYDAKKMESIRTIPIPEEEVEFLLSVMERYDAVPQMFIVTFMVMNCLLIVGFFRAGGDAKFGFYCDTIALWLVFIPLGALCGYVLKLPVMWVYFVICMDEAGKLPFNLYHYFKTNWARNITRDWN